MLRYDIQFVNDSVQTKIGPLVAAPIEINQLEYQLDLGGVFSLE